MKYRVVGSEVDLELTAEEIGEVIEALELTNPDGRVLAAWREFRQEEFAV